MNHRKNRSASVSASVLAAAASLAFSPGISALGLGDAQVESFLNQPLIARIDLISRESDDLESVTVQLASAADYELIGASREAVSVPIRFTVEDVDGDAYISATSSLPIGDPVLRLIVEVNWSSGRMLREYTLFLDPATLSESAPAPSPRIDQRQSAQATTAQPPAAPVTTTPVTQPEAADSVDEAASPLAGAEYGPVRGGETLWGIASDWARGSNLSINQVMIAIQRENPDAFLRDNINLLKRGAILRMPDIGDVEQISRAEAIREVASQAEAFSGSRQSSAASPATPLLAAESGAFEPATLAQAEEPAPAGPVPESPESADTTGSEAETAQSEESWDLLELVPPSAASSLESTAGFEEAVGDPAQGSGVEDLRESLARTEEELINQQQQNEYLEQRIRELESQLETSEQAGVADADMANMEDRLREQRQAAAREEGVERPWYARLSAWLIGLLVLAAAVVGWVLSRRGQGVSLEDAAGQSLRGIKSEAEDVLRVLADDKTVPSKPAGVDQEADPDQDSAAARKEPAQRKAPAEVHAEMLDEDSSDPEIQLDLARAYISMGDKEAARVILHEVVSNGSEEQQAEAKKMLDLLA